MLNTCRSVYLKSAWRFFLVQVGLPLSSTKPESDSGAIAGGVISVIIVLVAVGVLGFIYTR